MTNSNKIKIYVVSHSEEDIQKIRNDDVYTPLFVGRNGKDNLGFCSDDSGDNISSKNPNYCELTGLYWMWKESDADIIGLCHYRRYLKSDKGKLIEKEEIIEYLNENDIILPKKSELIKGSYWETYKDHYLLDALKITQEVIKNESPDYLETFNKILSQSEFVNYNMFIAKKELIKDYCEWVFPILESVENKINVEEYPRVFGLISEAIFNVWIEHNKLTIKECNIKYLGNKLKARMLLINNKPLRKVYKTILKKSNGDNFEKSIQNIFYK